MAMLKAPMEVNDLVEYSRPESDEERQFRFRVLEIHADVEEQIRLEYIIPVSELP